MAPISSPVFSKHYAVLNLNLMTILIDIVKDTTTGKKIISNCSRWIDAVHDKDPRPLTIFTSLVLSAGQPELAKDAPFTKLANDFDPFTAGSAAVKTSPSFAVYERDIVLQKTRWYAAAGNTLEQILRAQNIDTVIIVCFQLFPDDLDYC